EAGIAHTAHDLRAARADVWARQERPIEQRLDAVMLDHRGAADLGEEPGAEDAAQRAPGVIGTEAEEESGAGLVFLQQIDQARHSGYSCASATILSASSRTEMLFFGLPMLKILPEAMPFLFAMIAISASIPSSM